MPNIFDHCIKLCSYGTNYLGIVSCLFDSMHSERAQAMWEERASIVWCWSHRTTRSHPSQNRLSWQPDDYQQYVTFSVFHDTRL